MQRHAIIARIVDALQDIDLPIRRPRPAAEHPERRPDTADPPRHVCDVGDEEAFVVGFLAGDADGGAAGGGFGGAVDADVDGVGGLGGGADEFEGGGGGLGVVFYEAGGWVGVGEEVEGGEEVAGGVGVEEGVGARPACEEEEEGSEGGGGVHVGGYELCVVCAWVWIKVGVLEGCVRKMGVCGIDAIMYKCQELRLWCWRKTKDGDGNGIVGTKERQWVYGQVVKSEGSRQSGRGTMNETIIGCNVTMAFCT